MKMYKNSIIVTGAISLLTIILSIIVKNTHESSIYYDISMGVFSGTILTLITSIIGYRVEKVKTLREFRLKVNRFMKEVVNYDSSMSLERKVYYFLDLSNRDFDDIELALDDITFIFDFCNKDKKYIEDKIYLPIINLHNKVKERYWNFKWHVDGSGKNDRIMEDYVKELEDIIIEKKVWEEKSIDKEGNEHITQCNSSENKFTKSLRKELSGEYRKIMYEKILKEEKDL